MSADDFLNGFSRDDYLKFLELAVKEADAIFSRKENILKEAAAIKYSLAQAEENIQAEAKAWQEMSLPHKIATLQTLTDDYTQKHSLPHCEVTLLSETEKLFDCAAKFLTRDNKYYVKFSEEALNIGPCGSFESLEHELRHYYQIAAMLGIVDHPNKEEVELWKSTTKEDFSGPKDEDVHFWQPMEFDARRSAYQACEKRDMLLNYEEMSLQDSLELFKNPEAWTALSVDDKYIPIQSIICRLSEEFGMRAPELHFLHEKFLHQRSKSVAESFAHNNSLVFDDATSPDFLASPETLIWLVRSIRRSYHNAVLSGEIQSSKIDNSKFWQREKEAYEKIGFECYGEYSSPALEREAWNFARNFLLAYGFNFDNVYDAQKAKIRKSIRKNPSQGQVCPPRQKPIAERESIKHIVKGEGSGNNATPANQIINNTAPATGAGGQI